MRMSWLWLSAIGLLAGCSLSTVKSGGACQRSTQCLPGLACVSGKCSKDLSSIAATNTVPMLGESAGASSAAGSGGEAPAADGGQGAAGN
jgi:hypothetical protein